MDLKGTVFEDWWEALPALKRTPILINEIIDEAWEKDKELTMRFLFFTRDIKEGVGAREAFRIGWGKLSRIAPEPVIKNIELVPEYGRWDDLWRSDTHPLALINMAEFISKKLEDELAGGEVSTLAKWLPSENASSADTREMARTMMRLLRKTPREYRVTLSKLRARADLLESKMSAREWHDIDYKEVPSIAMTRYNKAFRKHDRHRYVAHWKEACKSQQSKKKPITNFKKDLDFIKGERYNRVKV